MIPDNEKPFEVGYGKPPRQTRFRKGSSGNPKGRPKGSHNVATILSRIGRERVKANGKNGSRWITKIEAALTQLSNKAAAGELRAIREFLYWIKSFQDSEQAALAPPVPHERDSAVMSSILKRIRKSEELPSDSGTNPAPKIPSPPEE